MYLPAREGRRRSIRQAKEAAIDEADNRNKK